ncbi:hypothetical protein F8B43_3405 [Methylorubrum populi]|uniref:Uncharacterized protein n=1 Tax=Methylorubrum populi TaxID=223967 RepID=A0A833J6A4_9HYPH|nr:hypothetical protein F8B43_3405 [Methylorubrum populi]
MLDREAEVSQDIVARAFDEALQLRPAIVELLGQMLERVTLPPGLPSF